MSSVAANRRLRLFPVGARRTSKPPESKAIAEVADAPSISGAATGTAEAKLAALTSNRLKPRNLYTNFSSDSF